MGLFVKICGVTSVEAAEACVEAGVDAVGFVFAESPRQVSPDLASAISSRMPPSIARVAVFRRPSPQDVVQVIAGFQPDVIQADHDCLPVIDGVGSLPVYHEGEEEAPPGGRFLYEGPVSGVGRGVDPVRATVFAQLGEMILAGGLSPENVGRSVVAVRPFGVDVSSGVEASPGVKSPALIRSFVAAVRAAEERLVSA
jgi:phosphoribosylanthranilate isomerase